MVWHELVRKGNHIYSSLPRSKDHSLDGILEVFGGHIDDTMMKNYNDNLFLSAVQASHYKAGLLHMSPTRMYVSNVSTY